MDDPLLLDLFCGAGGAARGYDLAGFRPERIVGVDNSPQPRYPYRFIQGDALEFLAKYGAGFDAVHASPPCQGYSIMHNLPWLRGKEYPVLILPLMEILDGLDSTPYVVENVMGARKGAKGLKKRDLEAHGLEAGWLCGTMFGMPFYRHRLFAANWLWLAPGHPRHTLNLHPRSERWVYGGSVKRLPGGEAGLDVKSRKPPSFSLWQQSSPVGLGHAAGWRLAGFNMGIDWMNRQELTQAIPPAYTETIGRQLLNFLRRIE